MPAAIEFAGTYADYLGKFSRYQDDQSRYLVWYGGAGSGKSHAAATRVLFRLMFEPVNHRILVVRKTFPSLRKSCFALLQDKIRQWGASDYFEVNKSDLTLTFRPNGNQIITASMDDPEKIKSIERVTSTWIEEPTEITESEFTQLDLRLRGDVGTYKQHILTFNPIDQNHWLKKHFFDRNVDNCTIDHSTAWGNPWIDREYLKILEGLAAQDSTMHDVYALGKWGVLKNIIYTNWDVVPEFPENCDYVIYGLDFGFNNPSVLVRIGEKDGEMYWEELLYQSGLTNDDLIKQLAELIPNKRDYIYGDTAEPARIEEIARAGYNIHPSDKSVKDGIDHCKRRKIHVTAGSSNGIKELQGYRYKEDKNGTVLDEPVKFNDHFCDAGRYAAYTHSKRHPGAWSGISIKSKR